MTTAAASLPLRLPDRPRVDADLYTPPLTLGGHLWRSALVLLLGTALGATTVDARSSTTGGAAVLAWVDVVVGLLAFGLTFLRRRWPLPIAVIVTLCGAVSTSAAGPGLLVGVSLATRRVVWQLVVVGVLGLATTVSLRLFQPAEAQGPWWLDVTVALAVTAAMFGWGLYIGSRRELLWTLRDRAERAEAERELRFRQGRANERARIAREMHDVLAHRISLVTMHAGALTYRTDLSPEQIRDTAEVIQRTSQEALADLRQVLGVLRGDADDVDEFPERPQPTFRDLPALVEEVRGSGVRVECEQDVPAAGTMPDVVGRTIYRVVQEGLTNARKHAPGTTVRVRVTGSPQDGLQVLISNPAHGVRPPAATAVPGAGLGLVGLRERVLLGGGRLETGSVAGRFELRAWLPWSA